MLTTEEVIFEHLYGDEHGEHHLLSLRIVNRKTLDETWFEIVIADKSGQKSPAELIEQAVNHLGSASVREQLLAQI